MLRLVHTLGPYCLVAATIAISTALPAHAGIIVGNPPRVVWSIATAEPDTRSLTTEVVGVTLHGCDGRDEHRVGAAEVDFVAGWAPSLPDGEWCGLSLELGRPLLRCDDLGCEELPGESIDFTPETDAGTGDVSMRGIIVGNPPLRAVVP